MTGSVFMNIVGAQQLKDTDGLGGGKSDSYVVVSIEGQDLKDQSVKTKVVDDCLEPIYDHQEALKFEWKDTRLQNDLYSLSIVVKDYDTSFSSDLIGTA